MGLVLRKYYSKDDPVQRGTCTSPVFGRECTVLLPFLGINIENVLSNVSYILPDINKWLTNMGLANLVAIKSQLTVRVLEGSRVIPVPIAPVFLTSLREARSVWVHEACTLFSCNENSLPPVSRLTALPGLVGLKQLYVTPGTKPQTNFLRWRALFSPDL